MTPRQAPGVGRRRLSRPAEWVLDCLLDDPTREWSGMELARTKGIPAGSVYPILARLEVAGWLASRRDPNGENTGTARRLYRLDAAGAAQVRRALSTTGPTTPGLTWGISSGGRA